jgi:hypothetical protein
MLPVWFHMNLFYIERGRREYCTYHKCSWKQDITYVGNKRLTPGLGAGFFLATLPGSARIPTLHGYLNCKDYQLIDGVFFLSRDPVPVSAYLPRPGEEGGEQQGGGDRHQAQGAPAGDAREHLQGDHLLRYTCR